MSTAPASPAAPTTSTERTLTSPIVGAHFRPPAKAILAVLPSGTALRLRPESDNPYDSNAIQVLCASEVLRALSAEVSRELEGEAMNYGFDLPSLLEPAEWHLGYIPRGLAEGWAVPVATAIGTTMEGGSEPGHYRDYHPATLSFDSAGKPTVQFTLPLLPPAESAE